MSKKKLSKEAVFEPEIYTVLSAGDLKLHDNFKIRKNGKYYTVHDKTLTNTAEIPNIKAQFYIVAVCNGKWYVFDYDKQVLACT